MSPLREFRSLTTRFEEDIKIELLRRYYLIFEGANTERKNFQGIDNNRKELGINSHIELVILHKEGDISSFSHPIKLLELIEEKKKSLKRDGKFDKAIDRFVIVFDRDSYEKPEDYVAPNKDKLFDNEKVSRAHSFASNLFSEISGVNPKSGSFFNKLKGGIDLAIEQERPLEQDILRMTTEIGSNVGVLIEQMLQKIIWGLPLGRVRRYVKEISPLPRII